MFRWCGADGELRTRSSAVSSLLFLSLFSIFLIIASEGATHALTPEQILLVANSREPASLEIARYYAARRKVPKENIVSVSLPCKDSISRAEFEDRLLAPLRRELSLPGWAATIRCIVLCYGIPLKVEGRVPSAAQRRRANALKDEISELRHVLQADRVSDEEKRQVRARVSRLEKERSRLLHRDESASVDSELCLLRSYPDDGPGYRLASWQPNPLFLANRDKKLPFEPEEIYMVVRLDGPDPATVRRMIDDALHAERQGLSGIACIDCRYRKIPEEGRLSAYHRYDRFLRLAAEELKRAPGIEDVVLDKGPGLFKPGSCRSVALYCGWYSLSRYVDAFEFVKGAVAWHIASGECVSLHKESAQWCRNLLLNGACATLGPVAEPYLQAFPPPHIFFRLLLDGRPCLAEVYYLTKPFLSWRLVLLGDPLYRPFRAFRPARRLGPPVRGLVPKSK
jgi:uncharacterized protein (TIGR03790 family)